MRPRRRIALGLCAGLLALGLQNLAATVVARGSAGRRDAEGWTRLTGAPLARQASELVWTGHALLAWSGSTRNGAYPADGALYDARTRRWGRVARAPIEGRVAAAAVWTGTRLLVWGGSGAPGGQVLGDGAAFDPATSAWTRIPVAPLSPRMPAAWAWTGREFLVWGDASRTASARDGAAYDPSANSWRRLPAAPFALNQASVALLDGQMVVYGAQLGSGNRASTRHAQGMAYSPASNRWRVLPAFPLSPQASAISVTGGRLIAWDYALDAAVYDPHSDRWTRLPRLPLRGGECYPTSASAGRFVVAWYCGRGAVLDTRSERWRRLPRPASAPPLDGPVAASGSVLFVGSGPHGHPGQLWEYQP